jgi:hypothetical protein
LNAVTSVTVGGKKMKEKDQEDNCSIDDVWHISGASKYFAAI